MIFIIIRTVFNIVFKQIQYGLVPIMHRKCYFCTIFFSSNGSPRLTEDRILEQAVFFGPEDPLHVCRITNSEHITFDMLAFVYQS